MAATERTLAKVGLAVAIVGAVFGLFILLASGMANLRDSAREEVFMAFPVPVLAMGLSIRAVALGYRRKTLPGVLSIAAYALIVSGGILLLAFATLQTYRH